MPVWIYVVPFIFIALLIIIMIPVMKKKGRQGIEEMTRIQNFPIHLFMLAGELKSINGKPENDIEKASYCYGLEDPGEIDVEFLPSFMHAKTHYYSRVPMHIKLIVEKGKTYQIGIEPNKPKEESTILDVSEVSDQKLLFKSKFYVVSKDITETKEAKGMRGVY